MVVVAQRTGFSTRVIGGGASRQVDGVCFDDGGGVSDMMVVLEVEAAVVVPVGFYGSRAQGGSTQGWRHAVCRAAVHRVAVHRAGATP